MTNYAEEESFVKKLFFSILDACVPTETTVVKEIVMHKMFTVVNLQGDTITLKLAQELGGKVFELKAMWIENYSEYGPSMEQVWDAFPDDVKKAFSDYVAQTLPNAYVVDQIPGIAYMRNVINAAKPANPYVVDHAGKSVEIAGKFFTVSGFLYSLLINIFFKLAYRAVFRPETLTPRNFAGDVLTGTASCGAIFATKVVLTAAMTTTPLTLLVGACCVTGWGASYLVRSWWGEDGSAAEKKAQVQQGGGGGAVGAAVAAGGGGGAANP